ncbi:MAG: hypothetical protein WAW37_03895 [Syntrophobacteraceae bacterium]
MNVRAKDLAERLGKFNDEIIAFVENCGEDDWGKMLAWEQWPVGVAVRHIGAGHYEAAALAGMIVRGEKLPEITGKQIVEMANQHAREHAGCTREEVLDVLRKNGRDMVGFVAGLDDSDLDRTGYLLMMDKDITAGEFIETVVLLSGGEHFNNIRVAVGR